jgi:hypothetical protein
MQAWGEARRAAAGPGANREAALGDARTSPFELIDDALALVHSHLNFDPDDRANLHLITITSVSVPMQAFWLRKGALFEPTDALEQLLKLSEVGDNLPLAAVACGARTLCIVPGSSLRHGPDGIDSITVFDHTGFPTGAVSERWLTFIAVKVRTSDRDELMAPALRILIDDDTMTIREAVQRYCIAGRGTPVGDAAGREFWPRVLSYAFKILFYLSSEQPQITQDNAYTNAPRKFSGLGKRRKSERLRDIDQLCDRYIVGPGIPPSLHERGAVHEGTGEGGEVSPHWRRGHFRLQRHGPGRSRTRVVFIMPIIVRADRLKSDSLRRLPTKSPARSLL